jgi:hypothetical protein
MRCFWPAFALAFLFSFMATPLQAAWALMNARISPTRQALVRSESLTGLGALPAFTQLSHVLRETGTTESTAGNLT